jgi:sarcosine oxidase subunit alpha
MWRIGFTGELSFEVHVPAAYGLYVWERLMEEGARFGVRAFGLEAQRIMRLEKGHFIVGQDTDATTGAFACGLEWLVKLDKDDFAGKPELVFERAHAERARLVALQPADPELVPPEASQIVSGAGSIEGRITSSRYSPTLLRSICLGLLSTRLAVPGMVVNVQLPDGRRAPATVMEHHAQFDPAGTRLRG